MNKQTVYGLLMRAAAQALMTLAAERLGAKIGLIAVLHTWGQTLNVPSNITIITLPAKCPELNPQENIWQFIRENWLSNRVFKSYDQIVDLCCDAWNKLIDQPWRIMSIGMREWVYRF